MQAIERFIGVDVAKRELVTCEHGAAGLHSVANEAAAIEAWLQRLPPGSAVAMESTGGYHALLAQQAHRAGLRVYVLNARDVYYYAKALGARSKTDRVDARLIARYLVEHHASMHAWQPARGGQDTVQSLLRRRARVSSHAAALRLALNGIESLSEPLARVQEQLDRLMERIDQDVERLLAVDADLSARRAALRTIAGVGAQGSALLAVLLSRIDFANADALVAYSGLDPRANDSGTKIGRRRLSKRGSATLRRQAYLAAFAASRSKAFRPTYLALKGRGFAPTQALVILGRKILRIAWAIWHSGQTFDPLRLRAPVTCATP